MATVAINLVKIRWPLVLAVLLAAFTSSDARAAASPASMSLLKKTGEYRLLTSRYGAAAVAIGEFVYVIGGASADAITDIERFDTKTHAIERVTDKLLPRIYHNAVEYEGRIYIFGGYGHGLPGQPYEGEVEIFNPATRQLTRGEKMPEARAHMAVTRVGAMVCLIGGTKKKNESETIHTGDMDFYDLRTGKWSKGPPMPTAREAQAATVGGYVLVPGGFRLNARVATVEMFVPKENAWKALPPLSRKISGHSLVMLGRFLFLLGEYSEMDSILAYDLSTRQSVDVDVPGFRGARHTASVVAGGQIYVIGGTIGDAMATSDRIEVLAPSLPDAK